MPRSYLKADGAAPVMVESIEHIVGICTGIYNDNSYIYTHQQFP